MTDNNSATKGKLQDFNFVGDGHFSLEDMLHVAYLEGKKDYQKDLLNTVNQGLQTSAVTSSLFKEKLKSKDIQVIDMYLRVIDFSEFECLVIISDKDYYTKTKRWEAYNISRNLNASIDKVDIKFSLMPFSEEMKTDSISSEGFYFKYDSEV